MTEIEFCEKYCGELTKEQIGMINYNINWIRTFGNRIENNYRLLLKSIKKIGLNPNNFPR